MPIRRRAVQRPRRPAPRLSPRLAGVGLRQLLNDVKDRSARQHASRQESSRRLNAAFVSLLDRISGRKDVDRLIRESSPRLHFRRPKRPKLIVPAAVDEILLSPFGQRVAPPFDYWGSLPAPGGGTVNAATGELFFDCDSIGVTHYSQVACAAVGIHVSPIKDANMNVFSSPSFFQQWQDYASIGSAHSDGFIGLWVGEYDQNGVFDRAIVDQRHKLWEDHQFLGDSGEHPDTVVAYPLTANCPVAAGRQYVISVSIFGSAYADWAPGAAYAKSLISAVVPSITWELT